MKREKKKNEEELNKKKIMEEIELKTEQKLVGYVSGVKNPIIEKLEPKHTVDIIQSILSDGSTEFREKMSRNMTYSEMREMYG